MTGKDTKDVAAASTANPTPSPPSAVEAIEEDDEFEEFEPCQWNKNDEDAEDSQQWQVRSLSVTGKMAPLSGNDLDVWVEGRCRSFSGTLRRHWRQNTWEY
ncbi:hypothetical protein ACHAW5_005633 [Stephanodiscus triporus]|uniref:Uncharacterized protein n=1 Tax=Stephanodiscus triporus TaxID=2934178 RepID=A0ABD3MT56_9STRA